MRSLVVGVGVGAGDAFGKGDSERERERFLLFSRVLCCSSKWVVRTVASLFVCECCGSVVQ